MANVDDPSELPVNDDSQSVETPCLASENEKIGSLGEESSNEIKKELEKEKKKESEVVDDSQLNTETNFNGMIEGITITEADNNDKNEKQKEVEGENILVAAEENIEFSTKSEIKVDEDNQIATKVDIDNHVESDLDLKHDVKPEIEGEKEPKEKEAEEVEEDEQEEEDGAEEEEEENCEEKVEKPLDDDQDRRNPQYIPKGGAFYEHDNRTSLEDVENEDPQEIEKKKKSWRESKESERWLHDCYNESEQQPKSTAEIIETYGYDIRNEDAPPRARRRRKYGRGPDKYERSWEDEKAYLVKQSNIGRRVKKKTFGNEEFPPLPNQKPESVGTKPVPKSLPKKKDEHSSKVRDGKVNGGEKSPGPSQNMRSSTSSFQPNKKNHNFINKKINDDNIKPFRNDSKRNNSSGRQDKSGRQDDFPNPIKTQTIRYSEPPFKRSTETNKNSVKEPDISHITEGVNQMTFHNRQMNIRDIRAKANGSVQEKINEPEVDSPIYRQNPKRYSKIRKGFTGIFPPEEVPDIDQSELHKIQQEQQKSHHLSLTQPMNMQNVMKRYAGTYDFVPGNTSYLPTRPILSAIAQQSMSPQGIHQQTLSPQGIPQQALSPQVSALQSIELPQNPLTQQNFVPQPMYIDMDAHYTSDVMAPFSGYPSYPASQTGDVYQPSRGITYYSTECQSSSQKRPPPPRRQKAAIPIVPPPEER